MRTVATSPDARDIRARIAWAGLRLYVIAPLVPLHPVRLGRALNGKEPLSPELAERIARAVDKLSGRGAR
jgi:hypothetical protein